MSTASIDNLPALKALVTRLNLVLANDAVTFQTAFVDGAPSSVLDALNDLVAEAHPGCSLVRRLNADDTTAEIGVIYKDGDQLVELL